MSVAASAAVEGAARWGGLRAAVARVRAALHATPPPAPVNATARPLVQRVVLTLEAAAEPFDLLELAADQPRLYWHARQRDPGGALAGVGEAAVHTLPAGTPVADWLTPLQPYFERADSDLRFYGGGAFAPATPGADLPAARFVLPRLTLQAGPDGRATWACHVVCAPGAAWAPALAAAAADLQALMQAPDPIGDDAWSALLSRDHQPDRAGWDAAMNTALDAITAGELAKVVLACRVHCRYARPVPPVALLRRLAAATPACYHFFVQPTPTSVFLGASPERLVRRDGRRLATEAMAGTLPRGQHAAHSRRLAAQLLHADKDRREHGLVMEGIAAALRPCCTRFSPAARVVIRELPHLLHLVQTATGTLRPAVPFATALAALHPTPAVGGTPTAAALALIARLEPAARGWYAGPVGWVGPTQAEFAVGIRSALLRDDAVTLHAGAGIVAGSDPTQEWVEIGTKLASLLSILDPAAART